MAFHRGNAYLTNVTADDLRTPWTSWELLVEDEHAVAVTDPLQHARYFRTKNMVIVSVYLKVKFGPGTPVPYTTIRVPLPPSVRVRTQAVFQNQVVIERFTGTVERKFSVGSMFVDGETGAVGTTAGEDALAS
eukprot:2347657-Pleurochrysis_carterae.AAC.1